MRNFRLQKKKFSAGTFDSDTSSAEPSQSQNSTTDNIDSTDNTNNSVTTAGDTSDTDSPVKPVGGKRFFDDSPQTEQSQVVINYY